MFKVNKAGIGTGTVTEQSPRQPYASSGAPEFRLAQLKPTVLPNVASPGLRDLIWMQYVMPAVDYLDAIRSESGDRYNEQAR